MNVTPAASANAKPAASGPDIAHIGYHRTGTNFLQHRVFAALQDQIFLPRSSGWWFFDEPGSFDEAAARAYFDEEHCKNPEGRPAVISAERLSGTIEVDDFSVAENLRRLNPAMRIIVVLRAQPDIFRSLYYLHVKDRGSLSFPDFVDRLTENRRCDYLAMVEHLFGIFGRQSVLVLLYEDLRANPKRFVDTICAFVGVTPPSGLDLSELVNAAASASEIQLRRRLNAVGAVGPLGKLGIKLARKADSLSEAIAGRPIAPINVEGVRERITEAYGDRNRALATLLERPLGDFGYPL